MIPKIKINRQRMKDAASDSTLLATDLAEYLVKKGMPFRKAHETVGEPRGRCSKKTDAASRNSGIETQEVFKVVRLRRYQNVRRATVRWPRADGIGAPSPDNIKTQIKHWRKELGG